jgi:redox-sensing transcriptional repressor
VSLARGVRARSGAGIPDATVARLPVYHRVLGAMLERGVVTVSSAELALGAGVTSAKLRKDLSHLGTYGTRGVGYDVGYLRFQISRELGLTQEWSVVVVGVGHLGHALVHYGGFAARGFRIVGMFDVAPDVVGSSIDSLDPPRKVEPLERLEAVIVETGAAIGVIATPASAAQEVCDRLVGAGITAILNFAPAVLSVPEGTDIRKVDLGLELQILAFHEQRKISAVRP